MEDGETGQHQSMMARLKEWSSRAREDLSVRARVGRLLWRASPSVAVALCGFVVVEGLLPNLALVAIGRATGDIPAAVSHGLGSPAGQRLTVALAIGGVFYALSLLRGPLEDLLSAYSSAAMATLMQRTLISAVSAPVGIEHLEDPDVLDRLASASGELLSAAPADAPMTMAGVAGDRLSGLFGCIVLGTFQWWAGLLLFVGWLSIRRPLLNLWAQRASLRRRATRPLRQSWHFLGMTWLANSAKEVRVFGLADWALGRHRDLWFEGMAPSWEGLRRVERRSTALAGVVFAMFVIVLSALSWAAYHDEITLRTLSVMLMVLPSTYQLSGVSSSSVQLEQMLAAVPDVDWLVASLGRRAPLSRATSPALSARSTAGPPARAPAHELCLRAVSYRYPSSDRDVLDQLELTVPAGRSLAVVGINGAGKTTLVTLIARLRDPTSGEITVDGSPLTDLPEREWQRNVAVVYQDFARYPLALRENVGFRDLGADIDDDIVQQALGRAGLEEAVASLPDGARTVLSRQYQGGSDLSGGQWQRLALARALYSVERGAGVLVLDEPTAQMDARAEAAFYNQFLELTAGVTTIVISHRFSTVRRADLIAVLDGGKITELGAHDELVSAGGTYAELFLAQAASFLDGADDAQGADGQA